AWKVFRREGGKASTMLANIAMFTLVAGGLFAINKAVSGEWNYQGGKRDTYYVEFPFQNDVPKHELGRESSREGALTHIIFNARQFTSHLAHNRGSFFR